jgi:hypothetical protein
LTDSGQEQTYSLSIAAPTEDNMDYAVDTFSGNDAEEAVRAGLGMDEQAWEALWQEPTTAQQGGQGTSGRTDHTAPHHSAHRQQVLE